MRVTMRGTWRIVKGAVPGARAGKGLSHGVQDGDAAAVDGHPARLGGAAGGGCAGGGGGGGGGGAAGAARDRGCRRGVRDADGGFAGAGDQAALAAGAAGGAAGGVLL